MTAHDYTHRYWGHDLTITPSENGLTIDGMIWGSGLCEGDYLLLANGEKTTRYRIIAIDHFADPQDMAKYTARFSPRMALDAAS